MLKMKEMTDNNKITIFNVIGKENNQTSDVDREIPTLKSTDNAGVSVKLVSGIIRFALRLGYLCLQRILMIESI